MHDKLLLGLIPIPSFVSFMHVHSIHFLSTKLHTFCEIKVMTYLNKNVTPNETITLQFAFSFNEHHTR